MVSAVVRIFDASLRISASDEANFAACRHLTCMDLAQAGGGLSAPAEFDLGFADLVARGERHEAEVLESFRRRGLTVVEIGYETGTERGASAATVEAVRSRVDVIYQAELLSVAGEDQPATLGRPDFLVRADLLAAPDGEPRPEGAWYEVVDAKLARTAKARAVLQITYYTALLAEKQGVAPRWMHLALGHGEMVSFKVNDFAAYERQVRHRLVEFVGGDHGAYPFADPYPEPVEHCAICRWRRTCSTRRRDDDDLSLVAGIARRQRQELKAAGITTRRALAACGQLPDLPRSGPDSLARVQQQARLQVASEDQGRTLYELVDPERDDEGSLVANRGLLALPHPVEGDLFFDIEGSRHFSDDGREFGLQYLFGIVDTADADEAGRPRYRQFWAFDRAGEKSAFEELVDFITERRETHPGLHVYHYNHYEPTSIDHLSELHETRTEAVGRLMGRFATREDEVDALFRLGVFVDLYRVVRQGVRAGVESYSIKRLETLCGYRRQVPLEEATEHLIRFEAALDECSGPTDTTSQGVVAGYNEDDCRATLALRDWLEGRREEMAERLSEVLPRPAAPEEAPQREDPEVERVTAALWAGIPDDPAQRTHDQQAKALLADLLGWHRRENKPAWWRYFYLRTLDDGDLLGEPDALAGLQGGEIVDQVKRSVVRRFSFPPQEHGFSPGDQAFDPATKTSWTVSAVDAEHGVVDLKIGQTNTGRLPTALVEGAPIDTKVLAQAVLALGERVANRGLGGTDAATALLTRRPPSGTGIGPGSLKDPDETASEAAVRLAPALADSYLPIQGPPGTGKTTTAAQQILALVKKGRTVGVTGPSHAVIHNLIDAVVRLADETGEKVEVGQRADENNPFLHDHAEAMAYPQLEAALRDGGIQVAAGTAWMWAKPQFASAVDTLFVDEAGQMSLANVLAVAGAGRNLMLLGDPQQLAQPSQAAHPPGAGVSALEHILGDRATMPSDAGLFMDLTWRMHPELCSYTSEVFYDGRLQWADGLELQSVLATGALSGSGVRVVEVSHSGNTNDSPEEAGAVATIVGGLIGHDWRDSAGIHHRLTAADILVVTPYNAQIRDIEDALDASGIADIQVGTVDKFQGRQAPVVIYSMASSSADDAPRGLEFLYDPHRLNVATSRARAMAIIVASPEIPRPWCTTPRQMQTVNATCEAWERSRPSRDSPAI
jgi:uncharacterized protein